MDRIIRPAKTLNKPDEPGPNPPELVVEAQTYTQSFIFSALFEHDEIVGEDDNV